MPRMMKVSVGTPTTTAKPNCARTAITLDIIAEEVPAMMMPPK
jgi:hypothetical protein